MALMGAPREELLELDEVSARAQEASVLLSIAQHGLPRLRAASWLRLLRRDEGQSPHPGGDADLGTH
jgi:hypothetical protein